MNSLDFLGRIVHLVGIGGTGMRGLAEVLISHGCSVTGSDLSPSDGTSRLTERGARIWYRHTRDNIRRGVACVVHTAAARDDNPELVEARRRGIPVLKYAQMLGLLMRLKQGICIAGTHGKSTTSAMTAWALVQAGMDPSVVVGANVPQLGGPARAGTGDHFVAEACEYDRSFHHLAPRAAALLNIDEDHLDYYSGLDEIVESFHTFAHLVPGDGLVVANGQDPNVEGAICGLDVPIETFAVDGQADWEARKVHGWRGRYTFEAYYRGEHFGAFRLSVPGTHNVENALAAMALAHWAGACPEAIRQALNTYAGADRRFQIRGEWGGVTVVDDYAHHPTEIQATLAAARGHFENRRIWVVFQPHQHSRTRFLLKDFATSFGIDAKIKIVVPDIYFVRDSAAWRQEVSSQELVDAITGLGGDACYLPTFDEIEEHLAAHLRPGDVLITMGAGDVWKIGHELAQRFQRDSQAG